MTNTDPRSAIASFAGILALVWTAIAVFSPGVIVIIGATLLWILTAFTRLSIKRHPETSPFLSRHVRQKPWSATETIASVGTVAAVVVGGAVALDAELWVAVTIAAGAIVFASWFYWRGRQPS